MNNNDKQLSKKLFYELDILDIPMFCFDHYGDNEAVNSIEINLSNIIIDNKKIERKIQITNRTKIPNGFAYDVFNCLIYLASQEMANTNVFPSIVRFNIADIIKIMNIADSGSNFEIVRNAIRNISDTSIVYYGKTKTDSGRNKSYIELKFSPIVTYGFKGNNNNGVVNETSFVQFHDIIVNNVSNNYMVIINFDDYLNLETSISRAIYLKIIRHLWYLEKIDKNTYNKDYNDLCQLLLLKPQKFRSKVINQLGKHLNELQKKEIISKWDIYKSTNTDNFIVSFYLANPLTVSQKEIQFIEQEVHQETDKIAKTVSEFQKINPEQYQIFYDEAEKEVLTKWASTDSLFYDSFILNTVHDKIANLA